MRKPVKIVDKDAGNTTKKKHLARGGSRASAPPWMRWALLTLCTPAMAAVVTDGGKGAHEQQRDLRQVAGAEPQNKKHQIR